MMPPHDVHDFVPFFFLLAFLSSLTFSDVRLPAEFNFLGPASRFDICKKKTSIKRKHWDYYQGQTLESIIGECKIIKRIVTPQMSE